MAPPSPSCTYRCASRSTTPCGSSRARGIGWAGAGKWTACSSGCRRSAGTWTSPSSILANRYDVPSAARRHTTRGTSTGTPSATLSPPTPRSRWPARSLVAPVAVPPCAADVGFARIARVANPACYIPAVRSRSFSWTVAALLASALAWTSVSHVVRKRSRTPDILVVVVDSLRADHLPGGGYSRSTAPFLGRWAADAGVFREAYTHGTQTRIAMASLFTGSLPTLHRVRDVKVVRGNGRSDAVSPRLVTWAESLRDAGYETWGYSANVNVSEKFGFAHGFTRWAQHQSDDPAILAADFLKQLRDRAARNPDVPLFAYLHFNGVHSPYFAPPPYDKAFPAPPGRRVWASYHHGVTANDLAFTVAQYDGAILYQDKVLSETLPAWESAVGPVPA